MVFRHPLEYEQDRYGEAAQVFQKVLTLQPSNGTAHAMAELCQFELGKDELALRDLLAADQLGIVHDERLRKVALYHVEFCNCGRAGSATLNKPCRRSRSIRSGRGSSLLHWARLQC